MSEKSEERNNEMWSEEREKRETMRWYMLPGDIALLRGKVEELSAYK